MHMHTDAYANNATSPTEEERNLFSFPPHIYTPPHHPLASRNEALASASSQILSQSQQQQQRVLLSAMLSSHCENMMAYAVAAGGRRAAVLVDSRRYRPNVEVAPSCPRCDSPNTKFCYYNNYSLSQPRYFCKGCRRYWTKGGSLRNVPVGGGCRKNRRGKTSRPTAAEGADVVVAAAAAAATTRSAAFSHRFHGPVRPDLLLEGMVGSNTADDLCCRPASPGNPAAAVADGSTIDLALLYAKFLKHQPDPADQCAASATESVDTMSGASSDMSQGTQPPVQSALSRDGFVDGELCQAPTSTEHRAAMMLHCAGASAQAPLGELSFGVDQCCYESLGLSAPVTDGGHLILPPPAAWDEETKYEPLDSPPEDDAMSFRHDGGGDDVWSNALRCQGLEAALCRP